MKERAEIRVKQPSARHSGFELRAGERILGTLRWRRGSRSVAQAEGVGVGSLELMAKRRHVVVARDNRSADRLATLEREGRGWVIPLAQEPVFHWKRMRSDRWTVSADDRLVLSFAANQGLVKSSLLIGRASRA